VATEWIPRAAALVASGPRVTTPGMRLVAAISAVMDGMASVSQVATSGSRDPCRSADSSSPKFPSLQMVLYRLAPVPRNQSARRLGAVPQTDSRTDVIHSPCTSRAQERIALPFPVRPKVPSRLHVDGLHALIANVTRDRELTVQVHDAPFAVLAPGRYVHAARGNALSATPLPDLASGARCSWQELNR